MYIEEVGDVWQRIERSLHNNGGFIKKSEQQWQKLSQRKPILYTPWGLPD